MSTNRCDTLRCMAIDKKRIVIQTRSDSMDDCVICMDSLKNSTTYCTPCGHTYHKKCFVEHSNSTHESCYSCPMCRGDLLLNLTHILHSKKCKCRQCEIRLAGRTDSQFEGVGCRSISSNMNEITYASMPELRFRYSERRYIDLYSGVNVVDTEFDAPIGSDIEIQNEVIEDIDTPNIDFPNIDFPNIENDSFGIINNDDPNIENDSFGIINNDDPNILNEPISDETYRQMFNNVNPNDLQGQVGIAIEVNQENYIVTAQEGWARVDQGDDRQMFNNVNPVDLQIQVDIPIEVNRENYIENYIDAPYLSNETGSDETGSDDDDNVLDMSPGVEMDV